MVTVLIVDDDKFTQTVLGTIFAKDATLSTLGVQAMMASSGEEALMVFRNHRPDVVASDVQMSGMDGFALCHAIRAEPGGEHVDLVVMSGVHRDAAVANRAREELGAEFFAKPYQLRDMIAHIAAICDQRNKRGDAHKPVPRARRGEMAGDGGHGQQGDLAERPLPAVLFDLLDNAANGYLTVRRGRVTKHIEMLVGHPLRVASSLREDKLGAFLVRQGVISTEDVRRAELWANDSGERFSSSLLSLGIVAPERMVNLLTMHMCHMLVQILRWPDGRWEFRAQDNPAGGPRGNPVDTIPLVLQGLRHTASFDDIPERVAAVEHKRLILTPRGQAMLGHVSEHLSSKLAQIWRANPSVSLAELLDARVDRNELFTSVEALLYCDAVAVDTAAVPQEIGENNRDTGDFTIEDLSEHSQSQASGRGSEGATTELYAMLFDDPGINAPMNVGELPIELPEETEIRSADSGIIDMVGLKGPDSESNYARRLILKEYLRIQGVDYYQVLEVDRNASEEQLAESLTLKRSKWSLEYYARYDLGRDYAKLEEVHAAYERAAEVLCEADKRAAYDRTLSRGFRALTGPVPSAEMAFLAGQDFLNQGRYDWAAEKMREAVKASPEEAAYHAVLGWTLYLSGKRTPRAADEARACINQALAINPDHVMSHEYKGLISAALGADDEEAIFHLERALEAAPERVLEGSTERGGGMMATLEELRRRRGELRPLERLYRRLIYRLAVTGNRPKIECQLWCRLAELCRFELKDEENAKVAYTAAVRLAPDDEQIQAALNELDDGKLEFASAQAERLRRQWRRDPMELKLGCSLMRNALEQQHHDAAFMTASALVARGSEDQEANELYRRYRPRFVIRAQRPLNAALWRLLCHSEDTDDKGLLFALMTPAVARIYPVRADDLEIDDSMAVDDTELPEKFLRMRMYLAHMLGVEAPQVFVRPDFGRQIHVGALDRPVLLAGDDILLSPERAELSFRLGRAMTYLLPGRWVAAARPARVLKAVVLALYARIHPELKMADPDGIVARATMALKAMDENSLNKAQAIVADIVGRNHAINLSQWQRSMQRTANHAGLLFCGDLPAAVRFSRDSGGGEGNDDLIEYAVDDAFLQVRAAVGLSIDV